MSAQHFALHVPNSPYGLCGRKATLNSNTFPSFSLNGGVDVDGVAMSTEQAAVASASTPKGVLVTRSETKPHQCVQQSTGHGVNLQAIDSQPRESRTRPHRSPLLSTPVVGSNSAVRLSPERWW